MIDSIVITVIIFMGGIICALVAIIYKFLSHRINNVDISYSEIIITVTQMKNDIKWIKNKML